MKELIPIIENNGVFYVSASRLIELGYKINPFASLSSVNLPRYDENGVMMDLLIPIEMISCNLIQDDNEDDVEHKECDCTYLIRDKSNGCIKVGRSKDVQGRLRSLSTGNISLEIELIINRDVESEIHQHYKPKSVKGEWFNLSKKDIEDIRYKYK